MDTKVHQLMSREVHCCRPGEPLAHAARLMWEHDIGCVPIVDEQAQVVGMITDRDIAMAAYLQGQTLHAIAIESVMAHQVQTVGSQDSARRAEDLMRQAQLHRLPVVDGGGKLVGLISLNDLARAPLEQGGRDVAETLAAVCEPRQQLTRARA